MASTFRWDQYPKSYWGTDRYVLYEQTFWSSSRRPDVENHFSLDLYRDVLIKVTSAYFSPQVNWHLNQFLISISGNGVLRWKKKKERETPLFLAQFHWAGNNRIVRQLFYITKLRELKLSLWQTQPPPSSISITRISLSAYKSTLSTERNRLKVISKASQQNNPHPWRLGTVNRRSSGQISEFSCKHARFWINLHHLMVA